MWYTLTLQIIHSQGIFDEEKRSKVKKSVCHVVN